jgi:mRNA interferase RelE/StbE
LKYTVLYHRNIKKDLKKLDEKAIRLFFKAVKEIILKDPYQGIKLKGRYRSLWKYRIGNYRTIYSVEGNKLMVLILRMRHRKNVYDSIYM